MDNEKDIIEEKFDQLPERFKEMVLDPDVDDAVVEIAKKYNLSAENTDRLNTKVFALLIGETTGKDFIKEIKDELKVDQKNAEDMFVDCSIVILDPIMDKFYYRNDPEEEAEEVKNIQLTPIDDREIEKETEDLLETYKTLGYKQTKATPSSISETYSQNLTTGDQVKSYNAISSAGKHTIDERQRILDGIENPGMLSARQPGTDLGESKDTDLWRNDLRMSTSERIAPPQVPPAEIRPPEVRPTETRNLLSEKLGGAFGLPKSETDYSIKTEKVEKKQVPEMKKIEIKKDPYRVSPEE